MKSYLSIMAAAAIVLSSCGNKQATTTEDATYADDPMEYALSLGLGWNLGNSFDAHENGVSGETLWHDQPATQQTFDAVKAAGFSSVRIPVTWMGHIGEAPEYKVEDALLDRVAEVCGFAKNAGLKCMVNIHHDGFGAATDPEVRKNHWLLIEDASQDSVLNAAIEAKIAAVWTQIANRFKDEDNWLMFETFNEIQDGKWGNGTNRTDGGAQYNTLNHWNQVALDAIRATGGKNLTRFVGIPGYVTQPHLTAPYLVLPTDPTPNRLMVAVHSYDPWDYAGSGKYSEWGHTGKDDVCPDGDEAAYIGMLKLLYDTYITKNIPVYFGEFGCVHRSDEKAEAFRKYYLEYVCHAFREYKMTGFFWDNGYYIDGGDDAFGLINHGNGEWIYNGEEIVKIMVDAWNNTDPAYTLDSIYSKAPVF